MALETGTYISDLVSTNPVSSDNISQGDDHIRLLKSTIKATFPNAAGPIGLSSAASSGAAILSVTDNTNAALRITQLGTGNALLVEDSTNPDSTPFVVDASGKVGIGTASPSFALDVSSNTNYMTRFGGTLNNYLGIQITNASNGSSACSYLQFGNDALGYASYIGHNSSTSTQPGGANALTLYQTLNAPMVFFTNSAERMRIDSSGNLLVGTSTDLVGAGKIQAFKSGGTVASFAVNGGYDAAYVYNIANTGYTSFRFSVNNNATAVGSIAHSTTATAYNTTSDYRLKEDYRPVSNALERIAALKPINFAWKSNGERVDGFLAHEAAEVVPEAITGVKDAVDEEGKPVYQGIDQSKLVPLLTAALQEALTEISSLKARVAALEAA